MDIHRLGLVDSLFRILDHNNIGNPDHAIARYFLENYARIGELNIYDVAAECYVSRSSIRRFCKQVGYDNFLDLKKEFKQFDYQYNYFMEMHKGNDFRGYYAKEIIAMVQEVDELISKAELEQMADHIYHSKRVFFLSSYSSSQCVMEFQRPLVLLHKIIQVMTDSNFDQETLLSLGSDDAVFMVSTMGNFARSNLSVLSRCHAYKALITTSHDESLVSTFDDIYYLTKDDYSNTKSVRGKFGTLYVLDILYNVYLKKYSNR